MRNWQFIIILSCKKQQNTSPKKKGPDFKNTHAHRCNQLMNSLRSRVAESFQKQQHPILQNISYLKYLKIPRERNHDRNCGHLQTSGTASRGKRKQKLQRKGRESGGKKNLNFDEVESTQMTDDRCLTAMDAWAQGMSSRRRRGSKSKLHTLVAMAAEALHAHTPSLLSLFSLLVLSPSIFFFWRNVF
jgi:hypothetical protein